MFLSPRQALSSVDSVMMMYPFFYRPPSLRLEQGWHQFPLGRFFQRLCSQVSPAGRDPEPSPHPAGLVADVACPYRPASGG